MWTKKLSARPPSETRLGLGMQVSKAGNRSKGKEDRQKMGSLEWLSLSRKPSESALTLKAVAEVENVCGPSFTLQMFTKLFS